MSTISILGCSADSLAVLMDILHESKGIKKFNIYRNIESLIIPNLPLANYKYQIFEPGLFPSSSDDVVFGVAGPFNKWSVFQYYKSHAGILEKRYITTIHKLAYVASSSMVDSGAILEPGVVVSSQSSIGFGSWIKRGVLVGHHNQIGAFTDINPGATISGKVSIGRGCIIGSGAVINDNISIGENCLIGSGSVVTKDIPSGVIAYGSPCRVVRENSKWKI